MIDLTFILLSLIYLQVGVGCSMNFLGYLHNTNDRLTKWDYTIAIAVAFIWPLMVSMRVFNYD